MSRTVSIAACNFIMRPVASFDEFAHHVRSVLDDARGADLAVLPELFTVELWTTREGWQTAPMSELTYLHGFTGDLQQLFESEAQERDQYIVAGSHLVHDEDGYRNVTWLYGPEGLVHVHAKTHIFPAEAEWATGEGDEMRVVDLPFARVGVNICYEAEIPELGASLTEQGVEIILCPSFTMTEHGFWRVRHCAAARAIENQVYAVHASTGGAGHATLPAGWAQSSVLTPCDAPWTPNGVAAQAPCNADGVATATVDLALLAQNRETGAAPTYRDRRRRAALYAGLPSHIGMAAA